MKKNLNLKIISAFVIATLGWQSAFAANPPVSQDSVDSNKIIKLKDGSIAREMINNQQRSLYQIALLSSISISELRAMNAGRFDKKDVVEVGERIVLPENSPLLPAIGLKDDEKDRYSNLPQLGSDENYDVKKDKDALSTQVASTLQTLASQDWKQITSSENGGISGHLKNRGKDYAESYVRNGVKNQVVDPVRNAVQDFLGRFGTAQLQFDLSDKGQFNNVNLKLFSPWYDTENTLIFSQISFQEYEHNRRIGNVGIGQRWDVADKNWLLGYNVFLDHDFQRDHNRLGIGAEAWTDYMKFAANYYHPLSDWKESKDFDDYLERAARGFDIRFQGYLPQYPHLGGSLMYEQYYGDKVALFGKDNLQKDPRAITVGLDYTPVPLFTIKADHKRGQDNKKATKAELTMNYRIGTPLKDQLDPDMVQSARSLKGSRYDLVDRNNYIVLEYKEKKMSVDLGLEQTQLIEGLSYPLSISVHNAKNLSSLAWSGDMLEIDAGGGFLCATTGICSSSSWLNPPVDTNNWQIVAPSYVDKNGHRRAANTNGQYTLSLTIKDARGKTATSNAVLFEVLPNPIMRKVGVWAIDKDGQTTAMASNSADGVSSMTVLATLVKPKVLNASITSMQDVDGFSDEDLMNRIPNTFESVLKSWTATSNGKKIALIDGTSGNVNACPTQEPCVIVKSFEKVKMGQKVSDKASTAAGLEVIGDSYILDVASNIDGSVDFSIEMDQFGASFNKATINFSGGKAGTVKVYRGDGTLVATQIGNSLVFDTSGPQEWKVDSEYYVKAYATDGTEIANPFIIWSLVGSNESACPGQATTAELPDALSNANGPWFNVAMGVGARYTIRSSRTNSYASSGTSIDGIAGAPTNLDLNPINALPPACAGDQGFKLQVVVH
ncbi:inverse autotransporter beta domain-containing protein [Gilliamella mensalis]|uniref:inverse autotransporter beta domain-containing protein n=1 Tax=Gilliamella mensalis TaxID=1908520 RepID=UPI000A159F06|nr:inverse autotransporter beta domain-containing protein [Gilliamella mensalis]